MLICVWSDIEIMPWKGLYLVGKVVRNGTIKLCQGSNFPPWVGVAY